MKRVVLIAIETQMYLQLSIVNKNQSVIIFQEVKKIVLFPACNEEMDSFNSFKTSPSALCLCLCLYV